MMRLLPVFGILLVLAALVLPAASVRGASLAVTRQDDPAPNGCAPDDCSLREAVIAANASAGVDVITVPAGSHALTRAGRGEQSASTGDLDITDDLTITGAGLGVTIIDGHGIDRVFDVLGEATDVQISGLTIRGGATEYLYGDGGGIRNVGHLTLNTVEVTGNTATDHDAGGIASGGTLDLALGTIVHGNTTTNTGGGVYSDGSLFINASTVSDNTAGLGAGGIANDGDAQIEQATISGNDAGGLDGGGIWNEGGTLTVVNSTISGNHSDVNGGGIGNGSNFGGATATIASSTITGNTAGAQGGGVSNVVGGDVSLEESILWGNDAGTPNDGCYGAVESLGYNLLGAASAGCNMTGDVSTNIIGQGPLLGPLADNGGLTRTHALLDGSPAFDGGRDVGCPATDQRGISRPQGAACDIGAFEIEVPEPEYVGDVDCDGDVDSVDALKVLRFVAALTPVAPCIDDGDVDCDGDKDSVDALRQLRFVAGLSALPTPSGCPAIGPAAP